MKTDTSNDKQVKNQEVLRSLPNSQQNVMVIS